MKVKELVKLLKGVNPNADIMIDLNGGTIYTIDEEETEEGNDPDELKTCSQYFLVNGHRV